MFVFFVCLFFCNYFLIQVGEGEPVLIPMQMTVKGCPIFLQITGPDHPVPTPIIRYSPVALSKVLATLHLLSLPLFSSAGSAWITCALMQSLIVQFALLVPHIS